MADAPQPQVQQAQQRFQQFLSLVPLTISIAGLPQADQGKYYNDDQMEIRMNLLRKAYKFARQLAKDVIQD